MNPPAHVAVVGAGITGLTVAHRLRQIAGPDQLRLTVLEAGDRLGGKILTETFAGVPIDAGAESLLSRVPQAAALCRELGLGEELVAPATDRPYIWTRDALRPLPPRLLAGLPDGPRAVLSCGTLSWPGLIRAGYDLAAPSRPLDHDVAIGELVRSRLGREVHERLIDPLLGGIHGGSCDTLSVRAVAPQFESAMARGHGLIRGLRELVAGMPDRAASTPIFLTLTGGLGDLVGALGSALPAVDIRTAAAVAAVSPQGDGRYAVSLADDGGSDLIADEVVLAVPAFAAADILAAAGSTVAARLRQIDYASVATILLEYRPEALRRPLDGSGFLVPRVESKTLTACTWCSAKWAHLAGDTAVLKASVGRDGDARALELDDGELIDRVHGDLSAAMGLREPPRLATVARWPHALAQYRVGHLDLVDQIEADLSALPGLRLAGAAYRGVGVASCIKSGEAVAAAVATSLALGTDRLTAITP